MLCLKWLMQEIVDFVKATKFDYSWNYSSSWHLLTRLIQICISIYFLPRQWLTKYCRKQIHFNCTKFDNQLALYSNDSLRKIENRFSEWRPSLQCFYVCMWPVNIYAQINVILIWRWSKWKCENWFLKPFTK